MNSFADALKEVDRIEVLTLIDNYVDVLLESSDMVTRPIHAKEGEIAKDTLLAEHGLSLLITVQKGAESFTILFDTGYSSVGVIHNMEYLGVRPEGIRTIVLSHGHMDHTGSLYPLVDRIPKPITLVVHPDAFLFPRYIQEEDGEKRLFPRILNRDDLNRKGVDILESKTPRIIADNMALVTGEVERTTSFEKGLAGAFIERGGVPMPDPILDDQAIILKLKDRGLVVISGCSHAGIINTVLYAKKLTRVNTIYTVMGGFHLSAGPEPEQIIERTVLELLAFEPKVIVPMHCTGLGAVYRFANAFPAAFILNSVGTTITL